MANFPTIGADLQAFAKLMYQNLYYQSSGMKFLNEGYMQQARGMGGEAPILEVLKQTATTVTVREGVDITTSLSPSLATYGSVLIDLTALKMDYSFQLSTLVSVTNIINALEGQMKLTEAEIAYKTDSYIFGEFVSAITGAADGSDAYTLGQTYEWAPAETQDYIDSLNELKAHLFNRRVYGDFRLGLGAMEYGKFVAALTSLLKYETKAGVAGVDIGDVATAYGISIFPINDTVLAEADDTENTIGFFANPIGAAGDYFFTAMTEWAGNYPGRPGSYVLEGNVLFGVKVVRPEAIIRLVSTISA